MKIKSLSIAAVLLAAAVTVAFAADVTGKWVAQMQGRQGTTEITFNLKAEGDTLTGNITDARGETPITEGKIEGDNISFVIVRTFGENEMKTLWKGVVSGDEIKFTREFQMPPGGFGGPGGMGKPAPGAGGGPGGPGGPGRQQEIIAKKVQ